MFTCEGYSHKDLIDLLGNDDAQWFIKGCPIPYSNGNPLWDRLESVSRKIKDANLKTVEHPTFVAPLLYIKSDHLGSGLKGVVNPVNGKRYDSKSAYEKDIKASGHVIMGNDAPKEANREIRGDFSGLKQDISKAVDQVFSNQPKGKKRK